MFHHLLSSFHNSILYIHYKFILYNFQLDFI